MGKILIVDDELGILEELSDYLANSYKIVTANSSSEAIKILESEEIDVAIIDMYMESEESGIDVLKAAKQISPLIQCIILTAYGTASNVVSAMRAGAYDYVEKQSPDIYENLVHRINKALEYRDSLQAYQKSEERYQTLIENLNEVIYMMDTRGYITYISPTVEQYTQYKPSEIIDQHFSYFVYPNDRSYVLDRFYDALNTNSNNFQPYEFRIIDKNQKIHYVRNSSRPLKENGKINCLIGSLIDITKQKEAEEQRKKAEKDLRKANKLLKKALDELKETQQKIIQQERLRDMGQLASGITHSFNDVLEVTLGLSDYMLNNPNILNDIETVKSYLKMIKNSSEDGRKLTERLKMFYRQRDEDEVFSPVNINELIKQVVLITQPKWKVQAQVQGIKIDVLTDLQDIPLINGKENELREVLTNLVFNAIDALTTGGTISLKTKVDGGKDVIIEVADTGIGMTEETKRRCFELYYSTKKDAGTGLGLAIAYGTIQRHDGKIDVQSELGKGTKFTIRLPIGTVTPKKEEESKPEKLEFEESKPEKSLRPLNVLVVDDSEPIQKILGLYLTAGGHKFELAGNGKEALEKFRSGTFDLVITDRAISDISGDKLAYHIKQMRPETPVIMITGLGNIMKASGEMPKDIDRLISKPLTMKELHQALAEITTLT